MTDLMTFQKQIRVQSHRGFEEELEIRGAVPGGEIVLDPRNGRTLDGWIHSSFGNEFSFRVVTRDNREIQRGRVEPERGEIGTSRRFRLTLAADLPPGIHNIYLYNSSLFNVKKYGLFPENNYTVQVPAVAPLSRSLSVWPAPAPSPLVAALSAV